MNLRAKSKTTSKKDIDIVSSFAQPAQVDDPKMYLKEIGHPSFPQTVVELPAPCSRVFGTETLKQVEKGRKQLPKRKERYERYRKRA